MRHSRLFPALLALALLAGCDDPPTAPGADDAPAFTILDGARGGTAHFFFLPPMVPAPSYSGTFDGTQSPVITVCELAGDVCGTTVTTFSGAQVKVDLAEEAYKASWKTKGAGLDPNKLYRIQVEVGGSVLGCADVNVLNNGSQIRMVDRDQYVATINGGTLAIRFRIEAVVPPPPPPSPPGGWQQGDVVAYPQISWGNPANVAGVLLNNYYDAVYASTFGVLEAGIAGAAGFSMLFQSASAVLAYQPSAGTIGPLTADLIDPTASASGAFGGEVVALKLNIDFNDNGLTGGTATVKFGDIRLCNSILTAYNGGSLRALLDAANIALGGGTVAHSISEIHATLVEVNAAFEAGSPSLYAQNHLVNGVCQPPPPPGGWETGDVITFSQDGWGGDPATAPAAALLLSQFALVYPSSSVEVGIHGTAGFSMTFSSAAAILGFLPAGGGIGSLNADLIDPSSSSAGVFGGDVLALQLNVDFADADVTRGATSPVFGDLSICAVPGLTRLHGMTVRQFLADANQALGGGTAASGYSIDEIWLVARTLSDAFLNGEPSQFAQNHLVNGTCLGSWQDGDVITHIQADWGDPIHAAGVLLATYFNQVYFSTGGVEVGLIGAAGFSMVFTSAGAIHDYQPSAGPVGPLNADLIDPMSTASGAFGGEVLALALNIDFSDAGHTTGASEDRFGDLLLCNLTATQGLNGSSIRQFAAIANTALGGGTTPYTLLDIHTLAQRVNGSFSNGMVSPFAQQNIFNGPCP